MAPSSSHEPVLVDAIADLLTAVPGPGIVIDATIGMGGHALAVLARGGDDLTLVGFDRDQEALDLARRRLAAFRDRVHLFHAPYDQMAEHVVPLTAHAGRVVGVLYDLGVSSLQLDRAGRGFSFRLDAPLDMRMDASTGRTAADVVNTASIDELRDLLRTYGEERHAVRIARAIVAARPVERTGELADIVSAAVPAAVRRAPRHPATRTFQALRIAVNDELDRFRASLPQALELAAPTHSDERGGRVAVLSYHSLEDRIAKRVFADAVTDCVCPPDLPVCACDRRAWAAPVFRGVVRPDGAEVARNPRARSAKLRAVEMIAPSPVTPSAVEGG